MYFFDFTPPLEDKDVIKEINLFAFSRLNKKDPGVRQTLLQFFFHKKITQLQI